MFFLVVETLKWACSVCCVETGRLQLSRRGSPRLSTSATAWKDTPGWTVNMSSVPQWQGTIAHGAVAGQPAPAASSVARAVRQSRDEAKLQAQVSALESVSVECQKLRGQNQALQQQLAALQPSEGVRGEVTNLLQSRFKDWLLRTGNMRQITDLLAAEGA